MQNSELQALLSRGDTPLVVDFWAAWCAPCRVTRPLLEKLAREYDGRVGFLEIDADASPDVARRYRVLGIPTVLAFQGGREAGRFTGAQTEAQYRALFEALAAGRQVRLPLAPFDRVLRLSAGAALAGIGVATGSLFLVGLGALLAFLGVYDRCPLWSALAHRVRRD